MKKSPHILFYFTKVLLKSLGVKNSLTNLALWNFFDFIFGATLLHMDFFVVTIQNINLVFQLRLLFPQNLMKITRKYSGAASKKLITTTSLQTTTSIILHCDVGQKSKFPVTSPEMKLTLSHGASGFLHKLGRVAYQMK